MGKKILLLLFAVFMLGNIAGCAETKQEEKEYYMTYLQQCKESGIRVYLTEYGANKKLKK